MGIVTINRNDKPVFRISVQVELNLACSAKEESESPEISLSDNPGTSLFKQQRIMELTNTYECPDNVRLNSS